MSFTEIFFVAWVLLLILSFFVWIMSVFLKNASIADILWGMGFIVVVWFYFSRCEGGNLFRRCCIVGTVTIWGLRLSLYLLWRNWNKPEDFRYQKFRKEYGENQYWWISLFQVFWLQATLLWLISLPLLGAQHDYVPLNFYDALAFVFWAFGIFFEVVGDWQLMQFKSKTGNRGKLLTTGLWKYTRHPNYFGDACLWWGYGFWSVAGGNDIPLLSSVLMTVLLLKVSGVTMLEKTLVQTKPGYEDYIRQTPAFLPFRWMDIRRFLQTISFVRYALEKWEKK